MILLHQSQKTLMLALALAVTPFYQIQAAVQKPNLRIVSVTSKVPQSVKPQSEFACHIEVKTFEGMHHGFLSCEVSPELEILGPSRMSFPDPTPKSPLRFVFTIRAMKATQKAVVKFHASAKPNIGSPCEDWTIDWVRIEK